MNTLTLTNGAQTFIFSDIGKLEGFEYPSVINSVEDVAGRSGAYYVTSKLGRRRLSWQGLLRNDVLEQRRALERAIRAGNLKRLSFQTCDGVSVYVDIEIERLTMPYHLGRTTYLIEAVAADWRFFSQVNNIVSVYQQSIIGGVDIPADIPMEFDGHDMTCDCPVPYSVTNAGTEESPALFTIHGPGSRFTITNTSIGESFEIIRTITASDVITVNQETGEVLLNGTQPIYSSRHGVIFMIPPGENTFELIAVGQTSQTFFEVTFPDTYLGI